MEIDTSNRCITCKYFHRGYFTHGDQTDMTFLAPHDDNNGVCLHEKVYCEGNASWTGIKEPIGTDSLVCEGYDGRAFLEVGIHFGCIHHDTGEIPDEVFYPHTRLRKPDN